jgi:flagellar M-ring protein FliF
MPPAITATLRRFTHAIREFTVGQRTIAIIGLAVLVVAAIGLTAWLSKPSYSPLFTSLSASDASSITQLLHTDGVPYQLSDGGASILVPEQDVDAERLKAASAGLPSLSQDGYGLLDNLGVTASAFQQTTTYQRALQGELANTIEAMNGVETASVKLAIPDQTVFTSEQTPTTASVFVHTQGNGSLSNSQVQAITHLVAASVDNLKPTNVSVISADGTLLSGSGAASSDKSASASTYEARTQTAIQTMLDRVLGAGNSTVVVAADLSQDTAKQVSQTYTAPTNAPAINEQSSSQVYSGDGSGSTATGVLGPDNIAVPTGTSTDGSYNSTSTTKNNAINSTTETRTIPAGAVTRQTISVAVNKAAANGITANKLEKMVDAAGGVNTKRGDSVDVQLVAFSKDGAAAAAAALGAQSGADTQQNIVKIATTAVTVFGILLGLFLLLRFITRAAKRRESAPLDLSSLDALTSAPGKPELESPFYPMETIASTVPDAPLSIEGSPEIEYDRMRANIDRMAGNNPQRTAEYLRSLMDEKQPV